MTKLQSGLSGLLMLQLILAFGLLLVSRQPDQNPQEPLLVFDQQQLDRVVISDNEGSVTVAKSDGRWWLPESDQLPASESKISNLITKLHGLTAGWPVSTTRSGRQRFEVDEDKYQRRVQLYQGDRLAGELYIGTSPGFRKVHARSANADAVYAVPLNSHELYSKSSDWLDKSLLAPNDILSIKGPDYVVKKTDDQWKLDISETSLEGAISGQPETVIDPEKVRQLVSAIESLQVLDIVGNSSDPESSETSGIQLEVSSREGNWIYRFSQAGDQYYVSRSDLEKTFKITKFDYDRIALIQLSDMIRVETEPSGEIAGDNGSS